MLDGTHGSAVFPHHQTFMSYAVTPKFMEHYIPKLAKMDINGRADVDLLTTFLATIFVILQAT
jgi:hypothetical protein